MKPRLRALLTLILAAGSANAATISKANNADNLHLGSCWIGNVAPGPNDIASFDFYPATQTRSPITTDLSWGGIAVGNYSTWGCKINPSPGTAYFQITLGAAGIVNDGKTGQNQDLVISADLLLAADQTWTGTGASSGSSLLAGGTYRPAGSYVDLGGHTLTISGLDAWFLGNNPAPFTLKNGTIILNADSLLKVTSGTRPTSNDPYPVCDVPSNVTIHLNPGSSLIPFNNPGIYENLQWNANVILNGGKLFASGYRGYFAGVADSTDNTVGGTIQVTAASSIELSSEISVATAAVGESTLHKITAPITGNQTLSIKNASKTAARNLIVLSGDNSGFTNLVSLAADNSDGLTSGRVRLASNTAGSPGPWSIASGNTLEIQNSSVSLGYLTSSGNVEAMGGSASTVNLNSAGTSTRTLNGAVSQAAGSVLHLHKAGTYQQVIATPNWNGDTFVDGGKLSLPKTFMADDRDVRIASGAVLKLTHGKVDRIGKLLIDGVEQVSGTWGGTGSGADHETSSIEGSGFLRVGAPPTAYEAWIESIDGLSGDANREPLADPDGDGAENFKEFAFGGDPLSGKNSGGISGELGTKLRLIVAMRTGAVFGNVSGEQVSAAVDGMIYRVQTATDPGAFPTGTVNEIPAFTPPGGLPALAVGWEYRGFETDQPVAALPRQFMRVVVELAP